MTAERWGPALDEGFSMWVELARIALAVQACPLVAGLHSGSRDAICTATPDGRLVGLFLHREIIVVGVIGRSPATITEIAAQVRAAVGVLAPALYVTVSVVAMLAIDHTSAGMSPHPCR